VLLLFVVGQSFLIGDFLKHGRGQHKEALEYIASVSDAETVSLGSNTDFLSKTMINYYEPRRMDGRTFVYVENFENAAVNPDWLLIVRSDCTGALPLEVCDLLRRDRRDLAAPPVLRHQVPGSDDVVVYNLDSQFLHWGLSGWNWSLYRKARN
jgi:hypothetical protein